MAAVETMLLLAAVPLVGLLVWGHRIGNQLLIRLTKPSASLLFVALGALRWTRGDPYDTWMLAGLVLGLAGDQLLLSARLFTAGLATFLACHLAYLVAFHQVRPITTWPEATALPLLALSLLIYRWLWPHLGRMRLPVLLYVVAITAMVWGAITVPVTTAVAWTAAPGSVLFLLSDITVARQRFVHQTLANRALGLPAYYTGQLLLALSIGTAG